MSDAAIEAIYRQTFADRLVTPEENEALISTLIELQQVRDGSSLPPLTPDKLVWLRAAAFRIACEYLVEDGDAEDPREENVKLLKAVNAVVHALETTCLLPSLEKEGGEEFSKEGVEELCKSLYETEEEWDGPEITVEESKALQDFLTEEETRPPLGMLVWLRSTAFRVGSQYLNEDNDKAKNVSLMRSINVVVHTLEFTCMKCVQLMFDFICSFFIHFYVGCTHNNSCQLLLFRPSKCRSKPFTLELPPSHSPSLETDFQTAIQTLWKLDSNRLQPHKDYSMNVQSSKHPCHKEDMATDPLFSDVNPQIFKSRPTFSAFLSLLDNYSSYCGDEEEVSEKEIRENRAFLNAVMETPPMKYCHQYCLAKEANYDGELIPESEHAFQNVLNSIWFKLYSRSGGGRRRKMDSSGFEHVFVGEVKNGQVSGFHNWIQFYLEEKRGNINYRGYIKPRSRDSTAETNDDDHVLTLQFSWNGVEKFVGTSFIGVSPEFEFALYTMAFLTAEKDEIAVALDTGGEIFDLNIKCHKYDGGTKVGSCYVEALAHYDE